MIKSGFSIYLKRHPEKLVIPIFIMLEALPLDFLRFDSHGVTKQWFIMAQINHQKDCNDVSIIFLNQIICHSLCLIALYEHIFNLKQVSI